MNRQPISSSHETTHPNLANTLTPRRTLLRPPIVWGLCFVLTILPYSAAVSASTAEPVWTTPFALTQGPSLMGGNWGKSIVSDGLGYVDVVWFQDASTFDNVPFFSVGTGLIVFAQSGDQGVNWTGQPVTIVAPDTGSPEIASSGANIYIVWYAADAATLNLQIYFMHGVRAGTQVQWSAPQTISGTPTGASATFPVVAAYGNNVYVAWSDTRNANVTEVYYTRSTNAGKTWSLPLALSPKDGFNSWTPSIATYSQYVYTAWTDTRFGSSTCAMNGADCHEVLFYRRSSDQGQTWEPEIELTCNAQLYTYAPSLFADSTSIHIAYFQGNPAPPGPMNLYYLRGKHNGLSLTACSGTQGVRPPINLQYPAGDAVLSEWRPVISVYNGVVNMVWSGELTNNYISGQSKVYYSASSDGAKWAAAVSLTPQNSGTTYRSVLPSISLSRDGSKAYIVWEDHRNDPDTQNYDYQVFFLSGALRLVR